MSCKHKLTLTKLQTFSAQTSVSSLCCLTETHSEQAGSGVLSGDWFVFQICRQLPMKAILVSQAMVPSYSAFCMSIWCLHIKLCGLNVCACGCWYCAFSNRTANVTDVIFRSGYNLILLKYCRSI